VKKIVIKYVIVFSAAFLLVASANAQLKKPGITLGANFVYSMPKGDFRDQYKFGAGGELYAGVGLGSTYLVGTVGMTSYKDESSNEAGTLTYIPVKLGLKKYFFLKKIFVQGDVGVATIKVQGISESDFTAGIGAGVRLLGLEAGLYSSTWKYSDKKGYANSLNAKIGYSFSL